LKWEELGHIPVVISKHLCIACSDWDWSQIHVRRDWSSHKGAWRPLYMDLGSDVVTAGFKRL